MLLHKGRRHWCQQYSGETDDFTAHLREPRSLGAGRSFGPRIIAGTWLWALSKGPRKPETLFDKKRHRWNLALNTLQVSGIDGWNPLDSSQEQSKARSSTWTVASELELCYRTHHAPAKPETSLTCNMYSNSTMFLGSANKFSICSDEESVLSLRIFILT